MRIREIKSLLTEAKSSSNGWMDDFSSKILFPQSKLYGEIKNGYNGFWRSIYEYTKVYFCKKTPDYSAVVVGCGERRIFIFRVTKNGQLHIANCVIAENKMEKVGDWEVKLHRPGSEAIYDLEVVRYDPVAKLEGKITGGGVRASDFKDNLRSTLIESAMAILHEVAYHRHPNYQRCLVVSRDGGKTLVAEYDGHVIETKQVVMDVTCKYCSR